MGLKFSDTLRLSWSNIAQHKKRSAAIILTISILFGIIMAFNFMLQGLRGTILDAALQANDGKVYLQTGYQNIDAINEGDFRPVDNLEAAQKMVRDAIQNYHGKVIGKQTIYHIGGTRWVIDQAVADAVGKLERNLNELDPDQIPILAPELEDAHFQEYLTYNDEKDERLVQVGTYSSSEPGNPTLPGFNPLNLLLGSVYGSSADAQPLIIDNGSDKVAKYINSMAQAEVEKGRYENIEQAFKNRPPETYYIAVFDNYNDAVAYYRDIHNNGSPKYIQIDTKKYNLLNMDIFGRVIYLELDFSNLQFMLTAIEVLFIIIAILIATFTFAHLIDSDAATVALYRSLGASTGNIYLIYFLYLVELCLLAILSCMLIAFIIVGIMWLGNAKALAERLKEFYMLKELPRVNLFGFNSIFFSIVGSIMLVAPLSLLLTMRCFSAKHIAKKLKED